MQADTAAARVPTDRPPVANEDAFPPESSRGAEIQAVIELLRGVLAPRSAVYVSAPITSGRRFLEWCAQRTRIANDQRDRLEKVIVPNRNAAIALVSRARTIASGNVIDPTVVGDIEGWTQSDYRAAWARVIQEFANTVVFANGWEFSNGCSYEFLIATKAGIKTLDEAWRPLHVGTGFTLLRNAIDELSSRSLPSEFLRGILEDLSTFSDGVGTPPLDATNFIRVETFKDAVLDSLANHGNVAQFVSFGPDLQIRHSRIAGLGANAVFANQRDAIAALLTASVERSVNVRSYHPDHPKSREFIYGLRELDAVENALRRLASDGLYTIVNETVDVNDGGVSGVALEGVIEFAPGDTPRCVEKPGTVSLPRHVGVAMLQRVYGFAPTFPAGRWRVEFSVHPVPRGHRQGHTILWEAEHEESNYNVSDVRWPNKFSRFLGDKVFGLLLADCLGFSVPTTHVFSRRVAPFTFGRSTGTAEPWIRTCPIEPVPGKFTTQRGWTDPFVLLAREDPDGRYLASVLSQEGVQSAFSGAAIASRGRDPIIEGVRGYGTEFMLGRQAPVQLPQPVVSVVTEVVERLLSTVGGTIKVEWAFDDEVLWVLQLQQLDTDVHHAVIVPGEPAHFRTFDVNDGIEAFRGFVDGAKAVGDGVVLKGSVGLTSHFGDILRRARVPSRLERG